jgi:hypothetical protein
MVMAATFLGGARSRLLPASIPFRFFGAAVVFHVLAWLAVLASGAETPGFAGGLGLPLTALHLVTLGVLVMTAIGASLQLLPVATRQSVGSPRALAVLWWCYTPGVALLTAAMALGQPQLLAAGAATVVLALSGYALLLARNLLGARGMAVVVVHGWATLGSLLAMLVSGLSLAAAYHGHGMFDRGTALGLHVSFAAYGFMGLLVLGFSYILVPMFALSDSPAQRPALTSAAAAIGALVLAALASFGTRPALLWPLAIVTGLVALALHVVLMTQALRTSLRPRLGRPFVLVRVGWAALGASLLAALALVLDAGVERLAGVFGVLLVGGLLSFLLGMLARIVPFLASMHAVPGRRGPPLPSALTAERPLAVHFMCHLAALGLLLAAVLADSAGLARAAGAVGTVGALAFARFFAFACQRMQAAPAPAPDSTPRV